MSEHIGNLEINREKQKPVFDTTQKFKQPEEKNARLEYIEQANMIERLSKAEQKKEIEYEKLAAKWEEMNKNGEGDGNFAGAKSYAQVVNTMERLIEAGKLKLDSRKQEVIRRSAKAYFANRKIGDKLVASQYSPTHEKLEDAETALLDTWRVKGDSTQMKNLKTGIRALRLFRKQELLQGNNNGGIVERVLEKKREMDGKMGDVIELCRIYMKHVDDPGSTTGKKRLALTSEILEYLQMEKNTQDELSFDKRSVLKGMATFPFGMQLRWNDLVEYMLRADDIMAGGSDEDIAEYETVVGYLSKDCPPINSKGKKTPLIPGLKVKSDREIKKVIARNTLTSEYKEIARKEPPINAVNSMGLATNNTFSNNVATDKGYCYDEFSEGIMMTISDEGFLYNDDKLQSIGIQPNQVESFRNDMKKLIKLSKENRYLQTVDAAITSCMSKQLKHDLSDEERKNVPKTDALLKNLEGEMQGEYKSNLNATFSSYVTKIDEALLTDLLDVISEILTKYHIDVAKVYRDNENARLQRYHDDEQYRDNRQLEDIEKNNRDYEKDSACYNDILSEMDTKEAVTFKNVNLGGIEIRVANTDDDPFTEDYSGLHLEDGKLKEIEELVEEYNSVSNKAVIYTDMRNRMIATKDSFNEEVNEIDDYEYLARFGDQIEDEYANTPEGIEIVSNMKDAIEKCEKEGTAREKFILNHLDWFGVNKERMLKLSYNVDDRELESIKQCLRDKLNDEQVNVIYNDETLNIKNDGIIGDEELETERDHVVYSLSRSFRSLYISNIDIHRVTFLSAITEKYNKKNREGYNFAEAFKSKGKVEYSDEFINKNAKWLVNGHGQRSCFRFDMFNKQKYYTDRSAVLSGKIKSILKNQK